MANGVSNDKSSYFDGMFSNAQGDKKVSKSSGYIPIGIMAGGVGMSLANCSGMFGLGGGEAGGNA